MANSSSLWSSARGIGSIISNRGAKKTPARPANYSPLSFVNKAKDYLAKSQAPRSGTPARRGPSVLSASTPKMPRNMFGGTRQSNLQRQSAARGAMSRFKGTAAGNNMARVQAKVAAARKARLLRSR